MADALAWAEHHSRPAKRPQTPAPSGWVSPQESFWVETAAAAAQEPQLMAAGSVSRTPQPISRL
eukprot:365743-Chlamydomonas_euryale.AAC.31